VLNGVINADYSSCSSSTTTGDTCIAVCSVGYTTTGDTAGFTLFCDDSGNYNAAADNLKCLANTCGGKAIFGISEANYSACSASMATGDTCTPECPNGFTASGSSAGFALICDDYGSFDARADRGDLVCSSNICEGSVSNGVVDADYSSCSSAKTGEMCTPVCLRGYSTIGAPASFILECNNTGGYDAAESGDFECSPNTFSESGSVSNGVPNADYSSCLSEPTSCITKCLPGYTKTGANVGFKLVCDENGECDANEDDGNLECSINTCNGQVWNGGHLTHADYSSCMAMQTGSVCIPTCLAGFKTSGATVGFSLVCRDNGDYDAAEDPGNLRCLINTCSGSVLGGVTDADYSSCSSATTGDICTPECGVGYTMKGVSAGFAVVCDDHGNYDATATGTLECSINTCTGSVANLVTNADYSSCWFKTTGDRCTPVCSSGYATTGASAGFSLVCDSNGNFDAAQDNGDLRCSINDKSFGESGSVSNGVANADYSSCGRSLETRGPCEPTCLAGFKKTGTAASSTLACDDNGNCVTVGGTGSMVCSINTCGGQVWNRIVGTDYSSCSVKPTGDTCTPVCLTGYVSTGFTLVCNDNGDYDAADLQCILAGPVSEEIEITPQTAVKCLPMRGKRVQTGLCRPPTEVTTTQSSFESTSSPEKGSAS
jgi:hypothetical protein